MNKSEKFSEGDSSYQMDVLSRVISLLFISHSLRDIFKKIRHSSHLTQWSDVSLSENYFFQFFVCYCLAKCITLPSIFYKWIFNWIESYYSSHIKSANLSCQYFLTLYVEELTLHVDVSTQHSYTLKLLSLSLAK